MTYNIITKKKISNIRINTISKDEKIINAPDVDAAGDVQKMKNGKDTTKKSMTIRIDPKIFTAYNEQLTAMYGKKHRKKSPIIETLLKQFNEQDALILKQYIVKDKPIININLDDIVEYQAQIQEKDKEIQSLQQAIQEKNDTIAALESSQHNLENTINDKYANEIQSLQLKIQDTENINTQIQESLNTKHNNDIQLLNSKHDKAIQSLTAAHKRELEILQKDIQSKEQTIQDKDNIINDYKEAIQDKEKEIQRLTDELNQSHKDTRAARNDFKHSTENLNKLQDDYNTIQNENKDYAVAFAEVKKMSIIEKILSRYPKKFLELSGNVDE